MSTPLSKEQLRQMRLKALGVSADDKSGADGSAGVNNSITCSPGQEGQKGPAVPPNNSISDSKTSSAASPSPSALDVSPSCSSGIFSRPLSEAELSSLQRVIYRGGYATEEDMMRWYSQGFGFCIEPFFGLRQGNGGPCGILAAVQAEILKEMLFPGNSAGYERTALPSASEVNIDQLLIKALCTILERAVIPTAENSNSGGIDSARTDHIRLCCVGETNRHMAMTAWKLSDITVISFDSIQNAITCIQANRHGLLEQFRSPTGCLTFLCSLVLTHGLNQTSADMDDSSNTLVGQFGHCNQDLINLLLTGRATSNVMDGEMQLGGDGDVDGGLKIRGVEKRSTIGYLSHLEALRYCQVGSYFKVPELPIWVIGSSSHFSVLFCLTQKVNQESRSEKLFSTLQRLFKAEDSAECGFIPAARLKDVLNPLVSHPEYASNALVTTILLDETNLARLRGHMQIDGEIILWSSFWANLSSLMCGKTLDDLITSPPVAAAAASVGTNAAAAAAGAGGGRLRSDSEIARELQAQMDGDFAMTLDGAASTDNTNINNNSHIHHHHNNNNNNNNNSTGSTSSTTNATTTTTTTTTTGRPRSDSEIARELQAQWDAEDTGGNTGGSTGGSGGSNVLPVTTTPTPLVSTTTTSNSHSHSHLSADSKVMQLDFSSIRANVHRSDSIAGDGADSFEMFHFNGLESSGRSARLCAFKLFVRSSVDAVGVSVAFEGGDHGSGSAGGSFICPIEEVLRTRWPGCRTVWKPQESAPSID